MKNIQKLILALIVVVVLAVATIGGITFGKNHANPFDRTAIALKKMCSESNTADITIKMSGSIDTKKFEEEMYYDMDEEEKAQIQFINKLVKNFMIEFNYIGVANEELPLEAKAQWTTNLMYGDELLLDLMMYVNGKEVGYASPSLMEAVFTFDKDDLYDELDIDIDDLADIDFEKYKKIISNKKLLKKIDKKKYKEIAREALEDKIEKGEKVDIELSDGDTVSCREYIFEFKFEDITDLISDLLREVEDDEELREYLRITGLAVVEEMLDSKDYKDFGLEKDDLKDAEDILEDEDDFEEGYEMAVDELKDGIDELENLIEEYDEKYEIRYAIDKKNTIRSIQSSVDISFVNLDAQIVYNSFGEDVEFMTFDDKEKIDILDLQNDSYEDNKQLFEDIFTDGVTNLFANRGLNDIIHDMEDNSSMLSEYDQDRILDIINIFNQGDEFIEDFIDEMVNELFWDKSFLPKDIM